MIVVLYHPGGMAVVIINSNIMLLIHGDCGNQPVVSTVVVMPSLPVSLAVIVSPIPKIPMISTALMTIVASGIIGVVVRAATNPKRKFAVAPCKCRCAAQGCRENAGAKR